MGQSGSKMSCSKMSRREYLLKKAGLAGLQALGTLIIVGTMFGSFGLIALVLLFNGIGCLGPGCIDTPQPSPARQFADLTPMLIFTIGIVFLGGWLLVSSSRQSASLPYVPPVHK